MVPPGPGSPRTGLSPWGGGPSHSGTGDATITMHVPTNAQALIAPAAPSDPPLVPRPLSFCQVPAHSPNPLIPLIPIEIKNPPNSADYFSEIATVVSASRTTNIGRPAQSSVPRPVFAANRKQPGIGAACHYLPSIETCCRPKLQFAARSGPHSGKAAPYDGNFRKNAPQHGTKLQPNWCKSMKNAPKPLRSNILPSH
jgi:hypothetical protein